MTKEKQELIARYAVAPIILILGSALSFLIYLVIIVLFYEASTWVFESMTGLQVEPPRIAFMSDYGEASKNGYWLFVWSSIVAGLLFSGWLPSLLGASIGKFVLGIRYLKENGRKVTFSNTLMLAMTSVVMFLLVALPGPIIGFTLGRGSEAASMSVLIAALVVLIVLSFWRDASGRTIYYRAAMIVPISTGQVAHFRDALAQLDRKSNSKDG